jgi:hypothetical protein
MVLAWTRNCIETLLAGEIDERRTPFIFYRELWMAKEVIKR